MRTQTDNPAYTGSEKDPEHGPAVAASIFTAVIVYVVRSAIIHLSPQHSRDIQLTDRAC